MIRVRIARVRPEKEIQLRNWLEELNKRADEVRATFYAETVRAEQAFIVPTSDGPLLIYAMEAEDFEQGSQAYARSTQPIDQEHRTIMQDCLEESLRLAPIYDVSLND
jgi:hypothetical protein